MRSLRFIIYFNLISRSKFRWLICCIIYEDYCFFDSPLLYYYINLISLIICWFFSRERYFSFCMSLSCPTFSSSFLTVSELFCSEFFWRFCDFISSFITSQITSCFSSFLNWSFLSSFKCICSRLFYMIKKFLLYLPVFT